MRQLPKKSDRRRCRWHRNQRDIRGVKASAKIQQSLRVCDQNDEVALRCSGHNPGKELKTVCSRPLVNPIDYMQIETYARTPNKAPVWFVHHCFLQHSCMRNPQTSISFEIHRREKRTKRQKPHHIFLNIHEVTACKLGDERSEERRVGKECRSRSSPYH